MVETPVKQITLKAFLALPETKPASEYLEGQIVQKPMPKGKHSAIQTELAIAINAVLRPRKLARAFNELRCSFGDNAIVPDTSVFVWSRISREHDGTIADTFSAAPDWVIEVLSPGQSQTKVTKKILHCLSNGTQMGWLIDPSAQAVIIYLSGQLPAIYNLEDKPKAQLPMPFFSQELKITVEEMFNWLLE